MEANHELSKLLLSEEAQKRIVLRLQADKKQTKAENSMRRAITSTHSLTSGHIG